MSTLISKNLVEKFSNPAKYKLTNEGVSIAMSLENCNGDELSSPYSSFSPVKSFEVSDKYEDFISPISDPIIKSPRTSISSFNLSPKAKNFSSTPLTENKITIVSPKKSDDNEEIQFLGETFNSSKGHNSIPILEDDIEVVQVDNSAKVDKKIRSFTFSDSDSDDLPDLDVFIKRKFDQSANKKSSKTTENVVNNQTNMNINSKSDYESKYQSPNKFSLQKNSIPEKVEISPIKLSTVIDEKEPPSKSIEVPSELPLFTLRPGEFDIILIVDNSEHYG